MLWVGISARELYAPRLPSKPSYGMGPAECGTGIYACPPNLVTFSGEIRPRNAR